MRRPVRPIDPSDAQEYEADLDAYEKKQSELEDAERDEKCKHEFIDKDYASATYGRCIVCKQLLFNL